MTKRNPGSGLAYIRNRYGVPAKRGMTIHYTGSPGKVYRDVRILSGQHGLLACKALVLVGGQWKVRRIFLHPTWEIAYTAPCAQCGQTVEPGRMCYATPTCHACLPPPRLPKTTQLPGARRG